MRTSDFRRVLTFDPGPVPGLGAPLILSFAILEWAAGALLVQPRLGITGGSLHAALLVVSVIVALAAHYAGNFWDTQLFDPRYGLSGSWRMRDERPWLGLLPSGRDLDRERTAAVRALRGDPAWVEDIEPTGEGVYKASRLVLEESGRLGEVAGLLAWSKVFRSLLWPLVLAALGFAIAAAGSSLLAWPGDPLPLALASLAALAGAGVVLPPYFGLRADYMTRLYHLAARPHRAAPHGD